MILLDTSILIDYLRSPSVEVLTLIELNDGAVCGVVRSEVLHGARSAEDLSGLISALDQFHQITTPENIWDELGRNLFILRKHGIRVPISDALIATLAIQNDLELWENDHHYPLMQRVMPGLRLFRPPDSSGN